MKNQLLIALIAVFTLLFVFSPNLIFAQNTGQSSPKSFSVKKEIKPAILNIVEGSLQFVEPTGNRAIDANENCNIVLSVRNDGTGDGFGCTAKLSATGTTAGVNYNASTKIPVIKVGATQFIEIPITATMHTADGNIDFTIIIDEPNGFGTAPTSISISTKEFLAPQLKIVDYTVTSAGGQTILSKRAPFDLQLLLQNTQHGLAENVKVQVSFPEGVFLLNGEEMSQFATLDGGISKSLEYNLIVNQNYSSETIPVEVKITEKYGRFAENRTIKLQLNQTLASSKITIDAEQEEQKNIVIASLTSDVDKNIPQGNVNQNNTFAVIIANENYRSEANVPFALNDGKIFSQYCETTLGLPEENIHFRQNVTLNELRAEIDWLKSVMKAYKGDCKVIFYYAGHGVPNESTNAAYLLPVDGSGMNSLTGYPLQDLYQAFAILPVQSVTIFLDACFSGTKREGDMLAQNGRGIAIKVKQDAVAGNMVVFSASQGDQTAYPFTEEGHGMFTYFLLKKLQETTGKVTYKALGDYITTQVERNSIIHNGKSQSPKVSPARNLGNAWETWQLVD